jgi:phosphoglycerate dehydrogenase-like enzyme
VVIDEAAMIEALESGDLRGAGLDVFEKEPHVPQALRDNPNVVLTPHIGGATHGAHERMREAFVGALVGHFEKQAGSAS